MIISIDLDGKVYDRLEEWGSRRGLTVEEALRMVIGNDFPDLPEPPQDYYVSMRYVIRPTSF